MQYWTALYGANKAGATTLAAGSSQVPDSGRQKIVRSVRSNPLRQYDLLGLYNLPKNTGPMNRGGPLAVRETLIGK
jgi:hypothetical protein